MSKEVLREYITEKDIDGIIDKYDPQYILLISARNDGKSYAIKRRALNRAFNAGEEFTYLRRYEIDIKRGSPKLYWGDFEPANEKTGKNVFQDITGGAWDTIGVKGLQSFHWGKLGNDGKIEEGPLIGYIHALSVATSYKSLQFPKVRTIIYEEMISNQFLFDEPRKLMNYVSTVFRSGEGRVFMVGNTITRINPYFREWQLTNFNKMKPGQIDIYDHTYTNDSGEESHTRILIHIPNVTGKNKGVKGMFFGSAAGMIAGQKWDTKEQPHLLGHVSEYDILYEVVFDFDHNATFLMQLVQHREKPDRVLWYITPKTTPLKANTRIVSPRLNELAGPLYTKDFVAISERERAAFQLLNYGRIAYGDNLTGTEFQRALRMSRTVDNTRE